MFKLKWLARTISTRHKGMCGWIGDSQLTGRMRPWGKTGLSRFGLSALKTPLPLETWARLLSFYMVLLPKQLIAAGRMVSFYDAFSSSSLPPSQGDKDKVSEKNHSYVLIAARRLNSLLRWRRKKDRSQHCRLVT